MTIHLAFAIEVASDAARPCAQQLLTLLHGIRAHRAPGDVYMCHVFYGAVPGPFLKELLALRGENFDIEPHFVDQPERERLLSYMSPRQRARYSWATMARLFLPKYLAEVDRVLYLDNDILCRADIAPVYSFDLKGHPVGLVHTFSPWEYGYNAGVMLMDLACIRKDADWETKMTTSIQEWDLKKFSFPDQTFINEYWRGNIEEMPEGYNHLPSLDPGGRTTATLVHFYDARFKMHAVTEYDVLNVEWSNEFNEVCREVQAKLASAQEGASHG